MSDAYRPTEFGSMNEEIQQAWAHTNETRAERLKKWRGNLSLEERLAQLEEMVFTEDDRLYTIVLPEYDEQINRAIRQSYETDNKAHEHYNQSVQEVRDTKRELEKSIQETLANTVKGLI